jgi:hypothetical protein
LSVITILQKSRSSSTTSTRIVAANWESTWDDIINHGGNPRWKIDDLHIKEQALQCIVQYCHQYRRRPVVAQDDGGVDNDSDEDALSRPPLLLHIFCPLAGDDPFVALAWQRGHTVTTIDLVPAAVASQRHQIGGIWTENIVTTPLGHHVTQWTHESGRAVLYVGDAFQSINTRGVGAERTKALAMVAQLWLRVVVGIATDAAGSLIHEYKGLKSKLQSEEEGGKEEKEKEEKSFVNSIRNASCLPRRHQQWSAPHTFWAVGQTKDSKSSRKGTSEKVP